MPEIRIAQNIPSEVLRQKLKSFGAFSELEIAAEVNATNGDKNIVFREVGLGERLRRFFLKIKQISKRVGKSLEIF